MTYEIEVLPAAERGLRMVHPQMRARIRGAVLKLATDPRPPGARALKDRPGYLRVRVGDYRMPWLHRGPPELLQSVRLLDLRR